jgi:hypothetical protein
MPSTTRRLRVVAVLAAVLVLTAACTDDESSGENAVRAFGDVQATEFEFEADPMDATRGVFRVETTEPMICAIVWGEPESLARLNNSQSMNGSGIVAHNVLLPDVEPGREYHFIVQGTTADGTLYRSDPGTFTIP